ncbi:MAG: SPOR domain-containing protein [Magnetococcales bacterium]|nr:SPOR domain-containing protein [Magnetococcales bacterium]
MSSRVSGMMGILAWTMAVLLLMGNLGYYSKLLMTQRVEGDLWTGPLMPGKRYGLPELGQARVLGSPEKKSDVAPEVSQEVKPQEVKTLAPPPEVLVKEEEKPPAPPPVVVPPEVKVEAKSGLDGAVGSGGFVVQVGNFVLEMGTDSLLARMRENGMDPQIGVKEESIRLNNVQAGPFRKMEEAKVMETVLKSNGYDVEVEETWEGYIISLSRSLLLGFAVHDMEKAQSLGITPLRMVKVEADMPVKNLFLGPYSSKDEARRVSERIAKLGLAVPVIKAWGPNVMGKIIKE